MGLAFVIFENIDTTFPVVKIQNVVQYLHDTRVYFFIVKETEQRLGDKTLTTKQTVHPSQSVSLF